MSNKEKFLKLVSDGKVDTVDRARNRLAKAYEELRVTDPIIGRKYHISWATSIKHVWRLKDIVGDTCYLSTKSGKIVSCQKSELLETRLNLELNKQSKINKTKRHGTKLFNNGKTVQLSVTRFR